MTISARACFGLLLLIAASNAPSLAQRTPAQSAVVQVVARDFSFDLPATIDGGMVTFQFENQGREPHYMRFMRLGEGKAIADVQDWRRSRTPTPAWLTPAGGIGTIGPGVTTRYSVRLDTGRYIALCGHPSPDGTPHVDKGMIREFAVGAVVSRSAPTVASKLEITDHAFAFDAPTASGTRTWHVVNRGGSAHQALLIRLDEGVSVDAELDWFRAGSRGPRPGRPIGGVIELAPGSEAWVTATLEPGNYVLLCSVASSATQRHFDRGMVRRFSVK